MASVGLHGRAIPPHQHQYQSIVVASILPSAVAAAAPSGAALGALPGAMAGVAAVAAATLATKQLFKVLCFWTFLGALFLEPFA